MVISYTLSSLGSSCGASILPPLPPFTIGANMLHKAIGEAYRPVQDRVGQCASGHGKHAVGRWWGNRWGQVGRCLEAKTGTGGEMTFIGEDTSDVICKMFKVDNLCVVRLVGWGTSPHHRSTTLRKNKAGSLRSLVALFF
jgi:hypothetical protein